MKTILYLAAIAIALSINFNISSTQTIDDKFSQKAKAYMPPDLVCHEGAYFSGNGEDFMYIDCFYCDFYEATRVWQQSSCEMNKYNR